jgi:ABC-type uncharacterized transport system substrate-binding protein
VFVGVGDAVGVGLIASLARPGGNITGSTFIGEETIGKQLELLKEVVPRVESAIPWRPGWWRASRDRAAMALASPISRWT